MADSIPAAYKGKIKFVDESISQDGDSVKRSDSDIAQIESVISEAHRDKKETVSKNGKRHPVLGELAFSKGDTRKQVIVNAKEVTENSEYDPVFSSTNNSHGWLDANGWESRKTFVLAGDGYIYDAFLKIAKAKDGRNILYGVNVDITKGTAVDKGATSKRAAVLAAIPNGDMVSQDGDSVKRSDSDIAQIESVISEAHRDKKETVSKNGKRHPVLGELAFSKGDTRKQVIVNAKEVTENSEYDPVFSSTNNSHGWLDANGWESRKTFVLAGDGYIYDAFLKIAKAKDGRNILYGVNVDITKGTAVDKGATSKRAAVLAAIPNGDMVSQDGDSVKRSDSDIAQIESVISEAHRDKEEMYSDFDGQEAPENVQQEIKCSTRFNEEYMDAAIARNEKLP